MPSHIYWDAKLDDIELGNLAYVMVNYIWVLWAINILFMCVVLLNLLIAVLSSAYEEALSENFAVKY
jgi:hypothetical protein